MTWQVIQLNKRSSTAKGYNYRWQQYRLSFLRHNPLCTFCQKDGRVTPATVVDHIKPHKGDSKLFWDRNNHQPLCKSHHDSTKQRMEKTGMQEIGADGWPVDTK